MKHKTFKRTLLVMLALIVLIVGMLVFLLFGPSVPIAVSKKTTYLLEPLDKFGHIDYFEAIRREHKRDVAVENNAAVLLWQAWGRRNLASDQVGPLFHELGIPVPPQNGDYLIRILDDESVSKGVEWLESLRSATPDVDASDGRDDQGVAPLGESDEPDLHDVVFELTSGAMDHPWRSEDFPPLAEWLKQNERPIELIYEATKRPRMYAPIVRPASDAGFGPTLIAVLMPTSQNCRDAARALAARSMWHLGEGRVDAAWEDAMACHRLARLVGQGPTLVDQLIGIAIDGIALRLDLAILEQPLTNEQLDTMRRNLADLASCGNMARSMDLGERFFFLDIVTAMARGADIGDLGGGSLSSIAMRVCIDWNVPLEIGNKWYDDLVTATSLPRFADRQAALEKTEARFEQLVNEGIMPTRLAKSLISRRIRSEVVGSTIASSILPAVTAVTKAEDRSDTYLALTQVAMELAVYRTAQRVYPETLEALGEDVFTNLPLDLFSERPFLYERRGEGYLLYSVGPNQRDDGASSSMMNLLEGVAIDDEDDAKFEQIDPDSDDFAIRLPRPPFSWSEQISNAVPGNGDEESEELGGASEKLEPQSVKSTPRRTAGQHVE